MDAIKVEPDSDEESLSVSSHSGEEQLIDIKHEMEPVPEPFCIVKTEAYVSYVHGHSFTSIPEGQST
jgi:hypothetical protein